MKIKLPPAISKQAQTTPEKPVAKAPSIVGPFIDRISITLSLKRRLLIEPFTNSQEWLKIVREKVQELPDTYCFNDM